MLDETMAARTADCFHSLTQAVCKDYLKRPAIRHPLLQLSFVSSPIRHNKECSHSSHYFLCRPLFFPMASLSCSHVYIYRVFIAVRSTLTAAVGTPTYDIANVSMHPPCTRKR
ncbi:hypothetical protein M413DRAFT_166078 [Hebeloma cylindrosporum]|uniref:Uncharacterized protein n=1 Tax=Hebeloma cylindrosporum TaxID=76867 RepID=A0A0C2XSI9_HEBCY|nr:hypothetical protein M413DRAFT_166078 [Hebeloma cylindrosporum h7]